MRPPRPAVTTNQTRQNPRKPPRREGEREEQKSPGEAGREGAVGEEGGGKARTQQETPVFVLVKPSGYFCSFKRKEAQQEREGQQLPAAHCSRW